MININFTSVYTKNRIELNQTNRKIESLQKYYKNNSNSKSIQLAIDNEINIFKNINNCLQQEKIKLYN